MPTMHLHLDRRRPAGTAPRVAAARAEDPPARRAVGLLRQLPLFEGVLGGEAETALREAQVVEQPAGTVLFTAGEPADRLYVLVDGRVRLMLGQGLSARMLPVLERGDTIGLAALLRGDLYPVGAAVVEHLLDETGILADFYGNVDGVLLREHSVWFDGATRDEVYARVAKRTLPGAVEPWGATRPTTARHLLFGGTPLARLGFDRGPFPLPGGRGTVQQGQLYRSAGRETSFVPTLRFVTDFAEDSAHTALAGGPSDRVRSRWYASGFDDWRAGRLKTLRP